jgi:hypothetical protein
LKQYHLLPNQVVYSRLIIIITNQKIKEKIRPISWNQSVITDCSHLLYCRLGYTADRINKMFDLTNTIRGLK